ncbi:hypothetical protein V8F20_001378 [Naviculisporaceae sp. PSN 640]
MPRFSDEEDSSDSDSDTSSIHSIPDDVSSTANKGSHGIGIGGGYSTDYFVTGGSHVSGKLVDNRSKRRLRSDSNDGRATKVQRLGSPDLEFTKDELAAIHRQDSADSDYETAEEEEEDDDEEDPEEDQLRDAKPEKATLGVGRLEPIRAIPPPTAAQRPSIRSHPAWPQQQSHSVKPQPPPANSNPNVLTAYEVMRKKLPHLRVLKEDVPYKIRFLADLPAKRVPIITNSFNTNKPQNTVSYLVQASGELLPKEEGCEMCRTTRGVYEGCVVSRDPILNESLRGACARCWYSRQGCKCSFRTGELDPEDVMDEETHLSNARAEYIENPPAVEKPKQEHSNTPVPIPQVPAVPYKQLQKEAQAYQERRSFPQPAQVRSISRENQISAPTRSTPNGASNPGATNSVRKETPVFPPKPNVIPSGRRDSLPETSRRLSSPRPALVVPKPESATATSNSTGSTGVASRTRHGAENGNGSGVAPSTGHQNHFAGLPVDLPNFVTQMQQINNQERSRKEASSGGADLMGERIDKWTKKYDGMAMQQLLSAHKQLVEQNAEHNARMAAMMSVLIKKVDQVLSQANGTENRN